MAVLELKWKFCWEFFLLTMQFVNFQFNRLKYLIGLLLFILKFSLILHSRNEIKLAESKLQRNLLATRDLNKFEVWSEALLRSTILSICERFWGIVAQCMKREESAREFFLFFSRNFSWFRETPKLHFEHLKSFFNRWLETFCLNFRTEPLNKTFFVKNENAKLTSKIIRNPKFILHSNFTIKTYFI